MKEVWGMPYVFDDYGNLNGGIIQSNINDMRINLVDHFSTSTTRKRNFNGFLELINFLKSNNLQSGVSSIWIDGSFCTNKINPNDIDLIILLKPYNINARTIQEHSDNIRSTFMEKHLDIYIVYDSNCLLNSNYIKEIMPTLKQSQLTYTEEAIREVLNENHREIDYHMKYWMGQFGFDREQRGKGLIALEGGDL